MDTTTPEGFREARRKLGLSQPRLAELLGADKSTVSRWERGVRGVDPLAARVMRWMLAGYRPPEWPL